MSKGLIFLDSSNPIVENTLKEKLLNPREKPEPFDVVASDFDDVRFRLVGTNISDRDQKIQVSLDMRCLKAIKPMGGQEVIDKLYGKMVTKTEAGYDLTLEMDVSSLPGKPEDIVKNVANLRGNLISAPFRKCFDALLSGNAGKLKPMVIPYRPNERMVLCPAADRVNVYISVAFDDDTDSAIASTFLQEFADSQRTIKNCPSVSFSRDPPKELKKVKGFKHNDTVNGYVQFQIFKSHVDAGKEGKVVELLQSFRYYIHYHIKASKAYLHQRMRNTVTQLMKKLNQADPEATKITEKKKFRTIK